MVWNPRDRFQARTILQHIILSIPDYSLLHFPARYFVYERFVLLKTVIKNFIQLPTDTG